jgi:hypothetical protein
MLSFYGGEQETANEIVRPRLRYGATCLLQRPAEPKPVKRAKAGGADRDRTGDPLLAKQVLSQLSYSPEVKMVGLGRVELPTSPLSGVRSNQLSYRPVFERCRKL